MQQEARDWTWQTLDGNACDAYIAGEITGLAEEVHKLAAALELGNVWTAAVQRSVLALHLAPVIAVHLHVLYGSEHRLWDTVAELMGERWRVVQGAALSDAGQPFRETCLAALELYVLAVRAIHDVVSDEQLRVVVHACALVKQVLGAGANAQDSPG